MRKVLVFVSTAAALAFSAAAMAKLQSSNGEHFSLGSERSTVTSETFAEQRARLVSEIEQGNTYVEISSLQRGEVMDSLNRMETWLRSAGSVDAMSDEQRIRLFNEQEKINTMLTGVAADSRLVCTREQTVGTRMRQTVCVTVAERRRRRDRDTEDAHRLFQGSLEDRL